MFFPNLITLIKPTDKVLDIGPGSSPYFRSDVLLELQADDDELKKQRGGTCDLKTNKKIVYYDGKSFPFKDKEFDYVICSHVIEHVYDVKKFTAEMFRVASKGYLEYPTILYEYLYNFDVHVNFIKKSEENLIYLPKQKTNLDEFLPVQKFYLATLGKGYTDTIDRLKNFMFEGFEWDKPFPVFPASDIRELVPPDGIPDNIRQKRLNILQAIYTKFLK